MPFYFLAKVLSWEKIQKSMKNSKELMQMYAPGGQFLKVIVLDTYNDYITTTTVLSQ